jgi:predicted TIM-barrel fold metal-dependent hydrolase
MSISILDTHQHLIYPERFPYSWTNGLPALAGKAFRYEDYLRAVEGCGVAGTIFMETAPDDPHYRGEVAHVLELSRKPGSLIRGMVASGRPEESTFQAWIESLPRPFVVGIRRILHVEPDDLPQREPFISNVKLLERHKLTFDLCVLPRQLPQGTELARKCPGVQFILDHCGIPDVAGNGLDPWRARIREIAALPNVACKLSGVLAYCKPGNATLDAIRPFIDYAIECFGPDRLVWGSDWPVVLLASNVKTWVQITRTLLGDLDPDAQKKILHDNAVRIYGLPSQPH